MVHLNRPSWCEGLINHACGNRMYLIPTTNSRTKQRSWMYICRTTSFAPSLRCGYARPRMESNKAETAIRRALTLDLEKRLTLNNVVRLAKEAAGGNDVAERRRDLARRRTAVLDRLRRAEGLYLDGKRAATWFATEEERARQILVDIEREDASLPSPVDREQLLATDTLFGELATALPFIGDQALRLMLERLGVAVVVPEGLTIQYTGGATGFIPEPTIVRLSQHRWPLRE
jgi:hypothetical protein